MLLTKKSRGEIVNNSMNIKISTFDIKSRESIEKLSS